MHGSAALGSAGLQHLAPWPRPLDLLDPGTWPPNFGAIKLPEAPTPEAMQQCSASQALEWLRSVAAGEPHAEEGLHADGVSRVNDLEKLCCRQDLGIPGGLPRVGSSLMGR
eukprot:scaffold164691_cov18-Tisochrysis_lutea.AAC.3